MKAVNYLKFALPKILANFVRIMRRDQNRLRAQVSPRNNVPVGDARSVFIRGNHSSTRDVSNATLKGNKLPFSSHDRVNNEELSKCVFRATMEQDLLHFLCMLIRTGPNKVHQLTSFALCLVPLRTRVGKSSSTTTTQG